MKQAIATVVALAVLFPGTAQAKHHRHHKANPGGVVAPRDYPTGGTEVPMLEGNTETGTVVY